MTKIIVKLKTPHSSRTRQHKKVKATAFDDKFFAVLTTRGKVFKYPIAHVAWIVESAETPDWIMKLARRQRLIERKEMELKEGIKA